ncbi:hypothetical protein [Rhizobium sp. BK176]|uniref:hypothetical protein n=1 Tax=Rhizobium sp. BK176 TaxID=2587071 RepID=UPI002166E298|nr:hypothetical protein [Rhizobium sp. BK176]MCS4089060.1 hypothetical protein [Rhizobium sp. BK176]
MATIRITWMTDEHECDDCGTSYASGASVEIEGHETLDLKPSAYCYDGSSYSRVEVYNAILAALGEYPEVEERECRELIECLGFEITEDVECGFDYDDDY